MTNGSRSSARTRSPGLPDREARRIETHLGRREARRERLSVRARELRREAQAMMIGLHEGRADRAKARRLSRALRSLSRATTTEASADAPLVRDALQEGVEALLLEAIVDRRPLPGPRALGVEPEPYLLGLGDVVGEVRRRALGQLAHDDLAAAEASVRLMERLYQTLMRFDTTRAIVPLKPKQDAARGLLERTRGEVVMARVHSRYRLARSEEE